MSIFARPGQDVLGVDISDHIIRAAVLRHERKTVKMVAHAQTEMAEGAIERGVIKSEDDVVDALKQLMKYLSHYKTHASVVAGLPEYHGFINTVTQTASSRKEEIERHLPFPYNEVRISTRTNTVQKNNLTQTILSFGAVKNETAESYENVWKRVGVHIRAMEIESQALARLLYNPETSNDSAVVICDIGHTHTTFVLMQNGHIDFTFTSQHISGAQLTQAIADEKSLSIQDARILKESLSLEEVPTVEPIIKKWSDKLTTELDRVVSFHRNHQLAEKSRSYSIVLTGGSSLLPGFIDRISDSTGILAQHAELPAHLKIPKKFNNTFSYSTALGLALRGIDQ